MKKNITFLTLFLQMMFLLSTQCVFSEENQRVLCLFPTLNHPSSTFVQKEVAKDLKGDDRPLLYFFEESKGKTPEKIQSYIEEVNPRIILCFGTLSLLSALEVEKERPLFFSMVYKTDPFLKRLQEQDNARGVFLNLKMDQPLELIQKISPDIQNIGVVYSQKYFHHSLEDFASSCLRLNLELKRFEVSSLKDIPKVIGSKTFQFDALYFLPDPMLMRKEIYKKLILESHKKGFFVFGDSYKIVGDGSLVSFKFDIQEQVQKLSQLIKEYLQKEDLTLLQNQNSEKFQYYLNLKTARSFGLSVPKAIKKGAKRVFNE